MADLWAASLHHKVEAWRRGELTEPQVRKLRGDLWVHRPAAVLDALEPWEREALEVDEPRTPAERAYAERRRERDATR